MSPIADKKGVTLVELLTAVVLVTVLAGVILTALIFFNGEVEEGSANSILLMRQENVADLLAREIRDASAVLQPDEHWEDLPYEDPVEAAATIVLYDTDGNDGNRYRVHDGRLQEKPAGQADWSDILYGDTPITVTSAGGFTLSEDRRTVILDLTLTMDDYSLPFGGGTYRCRN